MTVGFLVFLGVYLGGVLICKMHYRQKYSWRKKYYASEFCTDMLQPIMELIGNSMTAHNWHFEILKHQNHQEIENNLICLYSPKNSFRKFDCGLILMILSSAWVDINPNQKCVIVKPKLHATEWKVGFPSNLDNLEFKVEKCSHAGQVKLVIDGSGCFFGVDLDNQPIELEIVGFCKAKQRKDVLFV